MEASQFETANKLLSNIKILEETVLNYNPKNKFVHLQITDQYGNKREILKLYANTTEIERKLEDFISDKYSEFLSTVQNRINSEIEDLQRQFDNL